MNVAVFLPSWIGDAVMATPAVRALRRLAEGRLIGICKPYVHDLFAGCPWFDEFLFLDGKGPWSGRWPSVAWQLRKRHIDCAVLFPNSFRAALVARLGGCTRRIGFNRYLRGFLLTDKLEPVRDDRGRITPSPIIDDYNRLAVAAGCPHPGLGMELFTTPEYEAAAARLWDKLGLAEADDVVALNPGAAFGSSKHWQAEYFAILAQELVDRRGSRVLVICGPGERELARHIARLAARSAVSSIADEALSIGLTKALLRRVDLLITTDSGPRHIAAAFERRVLTLFGPTHIAWTETYQPLSVHLQKKVPCGPCQLRVCPVDHACMRDLKPAEVFAAANDLLERSGTGCGALPKSSAWGSVGGKPS